MAIVIEEKEIPRTFAREVSTLPLLGNLVKFYMNWIEVDGISAIRGGNITQPMVFWKDELNAFGNPSDTGAAMDWKANLEISEKHWLSCGVSIPKHAQCTMCGKRDLDE